MGENPNPSCQARLLSLPSRRDVCLTVPILVLPPRFPLQEPELFKCHRHVPATQWPVPVGSSLRRSGIGGGHGSDERLHLGGERLAHRARVFDDQGEPAPIQSAAVGMTKHVAKAAQ